MVVLKGTNRIFDRAYQEDPESTASVRKVNNIYGVTAYAELSNVIIPVVSDTLGVANATININGLGAVAIKTYNNLRTTS